MRIRLLAAVSMLALAGCFTIHRTEMPEFSMSRANEGKEIKVAIAGFAAKTVDYLSTYGYGTVYVDDGWRGPGWRRHGRWWGGGGHYETASYETLVPQIREDGTYLERARSLLEENGFLLRATPPDYTLEVVFDGPFVSSSDTGVSLAWMFLSVLSADYTVQTWNAKMKIYDAKTGRLLHSGSYRRRYEDIVWSPLFFVGLSGYAENSYQFIQRRCLESLTDEVVSDATAFLSSRTN